GRHRRGNAAPVKVAHDRVEDEGEEEGERHRQEEVTRDIEEADGEQAEDAGQDEPREGIARGGRQDDRRGFRRRLMQFRLLVHRRTPGNPVPSLEYFPTSRKNARRRLPFPPSLAPAFPPNAGSGSGTGAYAHAAGWRRTPQARSP